MTGNTAPPPSTASGQATERSALVAAFERAAVAAGSQVHRAASLDHVQALASALSGGAPVLVTTEVAADPVLAGAVGVATTDDATQAADRPVAIELGTLAVAETGSVLVREHDRASRLASMLARTLIQVVATDSVVATLDDVGAWLVEHAIDGYAALVTGPSRTADIERVITVGVQGPAQLHVVLVDRWDVESTP